LSIIISAKTACKENAVAVRRAGGLTVVFRGKNLP
jgi:hypothetical protein